MTRLLLVEDDRSLATGLADAFALEGFAVTVARDGMKGREQLLGTVRARMAGDALAAAIPFDVAVLDLMLPGRSGLDLLRELRALGSTLPVLVLTARGSESDKVIGLELGADDYVTKPFSLRELVARVRALVRRSERSVAPRRTEGMSDAAPEVPDRFRIGASEIDLAAFELRRDGRSFALSKKEAQLLALLWSKRGSVVSREQFLRLAWDDDVRVGARTVDTHMLHLRQKLEADPAAPRHLLTMHGVGYRLVVEPPPA